MKIALLLVGFGHVARRFITLLDEMHGTLTSADVQPVIAGVVTRRHGQVFDSAGLTAEGLRELTLEEERASSSSLPFLTTALERLRSGSDGTPVLVETTTLDIRSGEPAISHIRAAFAARAHVITANKGPVAFAYRSLAAEARDSGVSFLFEGAVMDGIPIFNLVREAMPGVTVNGFRGVVNSTTNYLLTAMERGEPFDEALQRMQAAGVAEADPSLDVDGWDAAAKTAALANVLLDADVTPLTIPREGVNAECGSRARQALASGQRLKLVASGHGWGSAATGRVQLVELAANDPLAQLDGQANALELDTWPLGRIMITQRDGGLEKTAYALFADLVTIGRRLSRRAVGQ